MPITPLQIMISKVWPMALVVLLGSFFALQVMIRGLIGAQLGGSTALFMLGAFVYLFATTSIGIYMGTLARTMPQFGLMAILLLLPLQILSGSITPRESMPELVQWKSEEHTSELQSRGHLVCRLLLEKKKVST